MPIFFYGKDEMKEFMGVFVKCSDKICDCSLLV